VFDDFRFVGLLGVERDHGRTVAQDGDAIADCEYLIEFVRDVDAGDAANREIAQDVEQDEDFVFCQGGRRLVQNEDLGTFEAPSRSPPTVSAHTELVTACWGRCRL